MRLTTQSLSLARSAFLSSRKPLTKNFNLLRNHVRFFKTDSEEVGLIKPPSLSLLKTIADVAVKHGFPTLEKTMVVGTQPFVLTTASMFDEIFNTFKLQPENTILLGKPYSANPSVVRYLADKGANVTIIPFPENYGGYQRTKMLSLKKAWEFARQLANHKGIENIIILDEGGGWTELKPPEITYEIANWGAIEQTRYGLYNPIIDAQHYRLINVAQSAAKVFGESMLIAETIVKKLDILINEINITTDDACGVIGNGAIGSAVAKRLLDLGFKKVIVYDESGKKFDDIYDLKCYRAGSIQMLIANASCIFGCTGRDVFKGLKISEIVRLPKTFISCSSEDVEFLSLLKEHANEVPINENTQNDAIKTLHFRSSNGHAIRIVRGGYPFNFDRSLYSMTAEDSTFTLALMLGSLIQSRLSMQMLVKNTNSINLGGIDMLDPIIQKVIFQLFVKNNPARFSPKLTACFDNDKWIKNNSAGEYHKNLWLQKCFNLILEEKRVPGMLIR